MKSQRIPEHKMNFTSEVAQTLENTASTGTNTANFKKETATNRNNSKMNK